MMTVKMILLDLDGTLLNSKKEVSSANFDALSKMAAQGTYIVPCTGRFFKAIPDQVRNLPFVRYCITINGAEVYDKETDTTLRQEALTTEQSQSIFRYLDKIDGIYDCFHNGSACMSEQHYQNIDKYLTSPSANSLVKATRTTVPNLHKAVEEWGDGVQKIQIFLGNTSEQTEIMSKMVADFPDMSISTSTDFNIEINNNQSEKGLGLLWLAQHLNIDPAHTMAFGDHSNDLGMLARAGTGVAMGNGIPAAKEVADYVTETNDQDGIAKALAHFNLI
ncbi:MAG: Cof-type HAD-IIB family hydrolase [Eubacteriales bacterium]